MLVRAHWDTRMPTDPLQESRETSVQVPWQSVTRSARVYFRASPMDRIRIIKSRVPATYVVTLTTKMQITREKFCTSLNLGRATVDRKIKNRAKLSQEESERVLAVARLVGQADAMVQESGTPHGFDAATWVASWLQRPHPALAGRVPAEILDTADGRNVVADLLAQQQSGAYS